MRFVHAAHNARAAGCPPCSYRHTLKGMVASLLDDGGMECYVITPTLLVPISGEWVQRLQQQKRQGRQFVLVRLRLPPRRRPAPLPLRSRAACRVLVGRQLREPGAHERPVWSDT